jgi:flavorubredoxin
MNLEALFKAIRNMEEDRKAITDGIKEAIKEHGTVNKVNPKSIRKAFRYWKECQENQAEAVKTQDEAFEMARKLGLPS